MSRRGGSDDEFRCPVCHYMFPIAQRDHVQRCVRREMAQDPRIQRRLRTENLAKQRGRSETTPVERPAAHAGAGGAGRGAGSVPSLALKPPQGKGAGKAKPKMTNPPKAAAGKKGPPTTTAAAAGQVPQAPSVNIGQGGLVISHQHVGKSRSATVSTTSQKTIDISVVPSDKTNKPSVDAAKVVTSPSAPVKQDSTATKLTLAKQDSAASKLTLAKQDSTASKLTKQESTASKLTKQDSTASKLTKQDSTASKLVKQDSVTSSKSTPAGSLSSSGGSSAAASTSSKKLSNSKDKDKKKSRNIKSSRGEAKKQEEAFSTTKPKTPREIITAVADMAKVPARVYSGMKQNAGTFWTFVITQDTTAVDLMELVAAKCGIPVEVMALYSNNADKPNIESRIKDDENVYAIKLQWQNTNSPNRFLLKERMPGDMLVRKSAAPVPPTSAPPPPPPPIGGFPKPKPPAQLAAEEQEQEQEYEEAEYEPEIEQAVDEDDRFLCPVFSALDSLPLDHSWNLLVGPSVTMLELLCFIAAKIDQPVDAIAAFAVSKITTHRISDAEIVSTLILNWQDRSVRMVVKPRPPGETVDTSGIDVNNLNVEEMDEETLLKEQWECKKEKLVDTLNQFFVNRPTREQLMQKKIYAHPGER